jgi:serine/threonine-protein kinase HipA
LALDLLGGKSLFASCQGLLEFAQTCDIDQPKARIQNLLAALEVVLERFPSLCEQAPHVVAAIRLSANPFIQAFG